MENHQFFSILSYHFVAVSKKCTPHFRSDPTITFSSKNHSRKYEGNTAQKSSELLDLIFSFCPANVAQRQSVGLGIERSRVRNSLVPSGFAFRQGDYSALLDDPVRWECQLDRALTIVRP